MKVSEAMTQTVCMAYPDQSLEEAARLMCDADIGCLPVRDEDRLVGMITDRDIAVRAVGCGMGPETPVREVMTSEVKYCFEDEDLDHVAQNMGASNNSAACRCSTATSNWSVCWRWVTWRCSTATARPAPP